VQRNGAPQFGAWHARGEAAIRARALHSHSCNRRGFMSNSLAWTPPIKAEGSRSRIQPAAAGSQ